jgi:hypothetical protein
LSHNSLHKKYYQGNTTEGAVLKATIKHRYWFIFSFILTLTACGQGRTPIAFTPVNPALEDDGGQLSRALGLTDESAPPNLMDSVIKQGVPQAVAAVAFAKYDQFESHVRNKEYMTIIDYTQASTVKRLYMINTKTGKVDALLVAHGKGSDPKNTGTPELFSNTLDSKMSSLGTFIVSESYKSPKHGAALKLDGLESSNSLARPRALLIHSAKYVNDQRAKLGMSWGCPAVSFDWIGKTIKRLVDGSFLYAYGNAQQPPNINLAVAERQLIDPSNSWLNETESAPLEGED